MLCYVMCVIFHDETRVFYLFIFTYLFCVYAVVILFCELKFVSETASLKSEDCSLYYFGMHQVQSN